MITDDDFRVAQTLATLITKAAEEGKQVTVWLASGKTLSDVQSAEVPGHIMTINGSYHVWRFRVDHVVGFSAS
ncbi:MAG: hypothetical protein IE932_14030 [Sphingopyxis terrae]|nr:hypothetical protein [Sphingopyxis terrae]